MIHNTEDT